MKYKHQYEVSEQSVDTRNYVIETDKPFSNNYGEILNAICEVDIAKEGDTYVGKTDDGVNFKVIYVDTDFGDDGHINWNMSDIEESEDVSANCWMS